MKRRGYIASSRSFKLWNAFHFLKERVWDIVVGSGSFTCCFESNEFDSSRDIVYYCIFVSFRAVQLQP